MFQHATFVRSAGHTISLLVHMLLCCRSGDECRHASGARREGAAHERQRETPHSNRQQGPFVQCLIARTQRAEGNIAHTGMRMNPLKSWTRSSVRMLASVMASSDLCAMVPVLLNLHQLQVDEEPCKVFALLFSIFFAVAFDDRLGVNFMGYQV
eukprot:6196884-Pleurochrysis_carterae.AAC.1